MADTYTQIYLHIIIAVRNRKCLIGRSWQDELFSYMTGIVQNKGHKMIRINGMPDHIHMLIGFHTTQSLSDLMRELKQYSTNWINSQDFYSEKFNWQKGYTALSCSRSSLDHVIRYIEDQEDHHMQRNFREEYIRFLEKYEIDFNENYLFKPVL